MQVDVSPWNGYSLAFSPDGNWIVVGKLNEDVLLIDIEAGELLGPFEGHSNAVDTILFSADGNRVVSGGRDGIVVWNFDPESGILEETVRFAGHTRPVRLIVRSDDDEHMLSVGHDDTVRYWSLVDGSEVHDFDDFERTPIAVAPGRERRTAYATDGQFLYTLDLSRGRTSAKRPLPGLGYSRVQEATFSPDGRFLAGASGSDLRVWGLPRLSTPRAFSGASGVNWCLCFTPDCERLITGTDRSIAIWDASNGRLLNTGEQQRFYPQHLTVSPDGSLAATTGDSLVRIWRLDGAE